jgi:ubiquitin-protein ligase
MTNYSFKRINVDIQNIIKDPLDNHNIFVWNNPENIQEAKIMMIGDENTPYEYGIFYFYLKFPDNYPFAPPMMKFLTSNGKTRFNPNLYINGKICLSLLNTWDGPRWTACNTLKSILISIKSMILGVEYPLENEPGYMLKTEQKQKLLQSTNIEKMNSDYVIYNEILKYQVFNHTLIEQYINPPIGTEVFNDVVEMYLSRNIHNIRDNICKNKEFLKSMNIKFLKLSYANTNDILDYETLIKRFDFTFSKFLTDNIATQDINDFEEKFNENNYLNVAVEKNLNDSDNNDKYNYNQELVNNQILIDDQTLIENQDLDKNSYQPNVSNNLDTIIHCPSPVENTSVNINNIVGLNNEINLNSLNTNIYIGTDTYTDNQNEFMDNNQVVESTEATELTDNISDHKRIKKCPNENAKLYEIGFVLKSENDGKNYIVKEYKKKKYVSGQVEVINVKRWVCFKK